MMTLAEGKVVGGRYELRRRIGSGGMADVWLASDRELDREVALKFLHERFARDAGFVERFRREARAAAGLSHPNVVGIYDRDEADGTHYIAMEYVQGASLAEMIHRGLTVGQAVEVVRQILIGAHFAHERGIVHRDLKPGNVLVDAEGRARVLDFGIARGGETDITQTGSVLGTAQYLSPEQAQGGEVTAASDIYSIGVILYEALTGRVPFEGDSAVGIAMRQVSERPEPPSRINPQVPPALDAVVLQALAKDPADRFASAEEFRRALDRAEAEPHAAGPATAAYAAPVATAPTAPVEERPTESGFMTRNRWIGLALLVLALGALLAFALTRPAEVRVPGVVGEDVAAATRALERVGLEAQRRPISSQAEADTVLEQDPRGGELAEEGSEVLLTVSTGPGIVEVPDVAGLRERAAVRALQDAGFQVSSRGRRSNDVPAGRAIGTVPGSGTPVQGGSTVRLLISRGPLVAEVPDVVGERENIATSTLERLGFIVNVDSEDADAPSGEVIDQDPDSGSVLEQGSRVTIVVSTGAGSVIVPDVVRQPEDTALEILADRDVENVRVVERDTEDPNEDGIVLAQAPDPGSRIRSSEVVTLFVGRFTEPSPTPEPGPGGDGTGSGAGDGDGSGTATGTGDGGGAADGSGDLGSEGPA